MMRLLVLGMVVGCAIADLSAIVTLQGKDVSGSVKFTKVANGLKVEGNVTGLTPGKHGFHVHQLGDLTNGCASTGGHFNPHKKNHGAPSDSERHVGDLGNILADQHGVAIISLEDKLISLEGEHNIIGRAVVVHEGVDDLGKGGAEDSLTTGHAGGRVACGIIGILSEKSSASIHSPIGLVTILSTLIYLITSSY